MDDGLSDSSSDDEPQTIRTTSRTSNNPYRPPRQPKKSTLPPPRPPADLQVFPNQITFDGVKPNLLYALTFSVMNSSKATKRVRIIPPSTSAFDLVYTPVAGIASGMEVKGEIEFQLPPDYDPTKCHSFSDSITVKCESESIVIPITALLPPANIDFESLANLEFCVPEVPVSKHVTFTNTGTEAGTFKISYDETLPIKITPTTGTLAAGRMNVDLDGDGRMEGGDEFVETKDGSNKINITIDYEATELGPFRALAEVHIVGEEIPKILDISAQVVEQKLELVNLDGGGALGEVRRRRELRGTLSDPASK